jgi:hypothetical protein
VHAVAAVGVAAGRQTVGVCLHGTLTFFSLLLLFYYYYNYYFLYVFIVIIVVVVVVVVVAVVIIPLWLLLYDMFAHLLVRATCAFVEHESFCFVFFSCNPLVFSVNLTDCFDYVNPPPPPIRVYEIIYYIINK